MVKKTSGWKKPPVGLGGGVGRAGSGVGSGAGQGEGRGGPVARWVGGWNQIIYSGISVASS